MTGSKFGWCIDAPGATHAYCSQCPREFTDQWGVVHRCGCPNHERNEESD